MIKSSVLALIDDANTRRAQRRRFLKLAGVSTAAVGGLSLLSGCFDDDDDDDDTPAPAPTPTPTPTPSAANLDPDILNLALNLEYLEAQFYSFAAFGVGLPADSLTGSVGTQGAVVGGRKVNFTDPVVAAYAREIAADEIAHVNFLRAAIGATARVAQPALNIDGGPTGAFTAAARAAGLVGMTESFDPYATDEAFLLGAYLFEDVGVTAYKGAAGLLTSKVFLEAAAGILAAEAYHAGLVRTVLYAKGMATPSLRTAANAISDARDSLDGSSNLDEGIVAANGDANLVPTDANGIAFSRTSQQVHNIVYLKSGTGMTSGGFFPAGTNNANASLKTT